MSYNAMFDNSTTPNKMRHPRGLRTRAVSGICPAQVAIIVNLASNPILNHGLCPRRFEDTPIAAVRAYTGIRARAISAIPPSRSGLANTRRGGGAQIISSSRTSRDLPISIAGTERRCSKSVRHRHRHYQFRARGAQVTAVDLTEQSLSLAASAPKSSGLEHRIRFVQADAEKLSESVPSSLTTWSTRSA